jgi:hypothetical protein
MNPATVYATSTQLFGIACATTRSCMAVGQRETHGSLTTLAEQWNGKHWLQRATRNPLPGDVLNSITCSSVVNCIAVGARNRGSAVRPLVEVWHGRGWQVSPGPSTQGTSLLGIACSSAKACTAIGSVARGAVDQTYAAQWNGHAWYAVPSQNPSTRDGFNGVACTRSHCFPVGYKLVGVATFQSLVEQGA